MRPETTSEHLSRDMREGRFPEQSEPQMVPVVAQGNKWSAAGLLDPHGTRYDCPRSELPMADLSDDELANGVYLFGDSQPPIAELLSGKAKTSGVWLDAAKNRIRWLSRKLDALAAERAAQTQRADAAEAEAHACGAEREAWKDRAIAAEAQVTDLTAKMEAMTNRKGFPILGQRGVYVDWQLVADHGGQANTNHGQTVAGLAGRGGLSWCELFAVLHNQRWQQIDANEAMIACRALEARYLAAIKAGGAA